MNIKHFSAGSTGLRTIAALGLLAWFGATAMAQPGIAYALIDDANTAAASAAFSVNPSGQAVKGFFITVGKYEVAFPGSGINVGWNVQVTAYGSDSNYCNISAWAGDLIAVACFDTSGHAANSRFSVLAISKNNDKNVAFAWANHPTASGYTPDAAYAYNPAGAITITRTVMGIFSVAFSGLNLSGGTVLVTAYGATNTFCSLGQPTSGNSAVVLCTDSGFTNRVDSEFVIAIIPAGVSPGGIAFTYANNPTAGSYTPASATTYNPGGPVQITRLSAGSYSVKFSGIDIAQIAGGNVRATSEPLGLAPRCKVIFWDNSGSTTITANVGCYETSGTPSDGEFQVMVIAPSAGLGFFPVTPCRVFDSRGPTGTFGGPSLAGGAARSIPVASSACGIPTSAAAYSLNATVVPKAGTLGFLTLWPTGQLQPNVSTLNSPDGSFVANAATVPAGSGGSIDVIATDATDFVLDINGYYAPPGATALGFYPIFGCRVIDTRQPAGPFGGPSIAGNTSRDFSLQTSGCPTPSSAQAYSVSVTVVPHGFLGYVTAWPTGQPRPNVSTLNSPDGSILANAAIVTAGNPNGSVSFFATNTTDLVVDINGYFAPPGAGGLYLYPMSPCRVVDTRTAIGPLGGPILASNTARTFPLAGACGLPSSASAYSLNSTVAPTGFLGFETIWPTGFAQPGVSILNDPKGIVTANGAMVPAGTSGSVNVYVLNTTHVILDVNGYFAR